MSEAEFAVFLANRTPGATSAGAFSKPNKFRNVKVVYEGLKFDSKKELKWWLILLQDQADGKIRDLKRQVRFVLADKADLGGKRLTPDLRYYADYVYVEVATGARIVADAKGKRTREYMQKRHLMWAIHKILVKEL